jgi:DNA polymerase-3 subunit beta
MSYAAYGFDAKKQSRDDDGPAGQFWCLWCTNNTVTGFSMCFSNWCICNECVRNISANGRDFERKENTQCFKCKATNVSGYRQHSSLTGADIEICEQCISWAYSVLKYNHLQTFDKTITMEGTTAIFSEEALDVLKHCTVDKNTVHLPKAKISAEAYTEVKEHLGKLGGTFTSKKTVEFTDVPENLLNTDYPVVEAPAPAPPKPERTKSRKRTADMHAIIMNNDALLTALKKCREVIDKKPALASIANVLLRVNNDSMQLICTDLEVTLITTLTCENEDKAKFEVLLPFDLFFDVVRLNHHNLLEMETDTVKASFKGLNDKFEVNALEEVAEFPTIPEFPDSAEYKINSDFIHSINAALTTVSKDTLRPSMTKVCVEFRDGYMHVVSTNANVLFRKSTEVGILGHTELLIGEKVARALNGFTETMITWNENHVAFKCGDLTVIATRQAEKYPDYRNVIPEHNTNLVLNRMEFISALERVLITTDRTRMAKLYLKSHIGQIRLEAVDLDRSRRTYVDLPADYVGNCESIAFDASYMITLLKQVNYEDIHLAIEVPEKAMLLRNNTDDGYLGLIMPLLTGV